MRRDGGNVPGAGVWVFAAVRESLGVETEGDDPKRDAAERLEPVPRRGNVDCLLYTSDAADE